MGEALLTIYEKERFFQKTKKLLDPIQKTKFYNFKETSSKSNKNAPNKKIARFKEVQYFWGFRRSFFQKNYGIHTLPGFKRIDLIFDRYEDISIKFLETKLRSKNQIVKNIIIFNDCKAFLTNAHNKLQLVQFLCTNAPKYAQVKEDCEMYICGGFDDTTKCFKLQGSSICEVLELQSNHLEADSRMFAHIFHAVRIQSAHIIIISADTDVFVLAVYFWKYLANIGCLGLWFDGSHTKKCFLGCHLAAESLGENICNILPASHAVSGCDTTSRFGSKMQWLKAASEDFVQTALMPLGILDLNNEQFKQSRNLFCISLCKCTNNKCKNKNE
ncbi:hypothetical protein ACJJTC_015226 [Scirpophaga incertulas]